MSLRGYAATRLGVEELMRQLYREAIARGLGPSKGHAAHCRQSGLDLECPPRPFLRGSATFEPLPWRRTPLGGSNELSGKGTPEARQWVALDESLHKKVQTQIDY